jgi:hypothetical protein
MLVDVNAKAVCQIDIDSTEAFRLLCKTLHMDFVLDEDTKFFVKENDLGEKYVYHIKDGHDEIYDYRGHLFVALRNVAVQMFPNVYFRGDDYIYD